jgi:hypothetical protein
MADLVIRWTNPEARDWTDTIPLSIFEREETRGFSHLTVKGREAIECQVNATMIGPIAILDYAGMHTAQNEENDLYIGQTIISFEDSNRTAVKHIFWREEETGVVEDLSPDFSVS